MSRMYAEPEEQADEPGENRPPATGANGEFLTDADLFQEVYGELHNIAKAHMSHQNGMHTLQATALVNEAYLRISERGVRWYDREHFFRLTSTVMRRILIDHARKRDAEKRSTEGTRVDLEELDELVVLFEAKGGNLIRLDEALQVLERKDPELTRLLELRFFGGRTVEEIAALQKVSTRTVTRRLETARMFLHQEIKR